MNCEEYFVFIYQKVKVDLFRYILTHMKDWDTAEDVCQEVFLEAYRKIEEFYTHPEPRGYLFRIAQFKIMKFSIHRKKRSEIEIFLDENVESDSMITFDETERINLYITLQQILSDEELTLLDEYCLQGLTSKEIAATRQKTDSAIRMSYQRLIKKLAKQLESSVKNQCNH